MQRHERPVPRFNPSGRKVWVARYTSSREKTDDGKPRRPSAGTFEKRGPCKQPSATGDCCAVHAIAAAYERERRGPVTAKTVRGYVATWTKVHPRSGRTNATNDSRLRRVLDEKIDGFPFGDWPLDQLRRRHATLLLDVLLTKQGRAAGGATNILRTLSALFEDAMTDELCDLNPFRGVKVRASDPRIQKAPRDPRILSWEQMYRLAGAAGEYEAMVRVAANCGLRLGELLGLYRQDLKLGACDEPGCRVTGSHLHVRRSAHDGEVTQGTKRERMRQAFEGGRVVPIPARLEPFLRAMPPRIDTPLLFPTQRGKCWWEDNFRTDVWTPARRASGVDASPQDFRHSWITHMRAAGVDPADLAQMAGHSVATATSVYTHALGQSYDAVRAACG